MPGSQEIMLTLKTIFMHEHCKWIFVAEWLACLAHVQGYPVWILTWDLSFLPYSLTKYMNLPLISVQVQAQSLPNLQPLYINSSIVPPSVYPYATPWDFLWMPMTPLSSIWKFLPLQRLYDEQQKLLGALGQRSKGEQMRHCPYESWSLTQTYLWGLGCGAAPKHTDRWELQSFRTQCKNCSNAPTHCVKWILYVKLKIPFQFFGYMLQIL